MIHSGNSSPPHAAPRSMGDHGREIYDDAQALRNAVGTAADDLKYYLTDQASRRPYRTLGVAAGVGFVLGGGLRSRLTSVFLGAATKVAVSMAAREIAARLLSEASTPVLGRSPETVSGPGKERS